MKYIIYCDGSCRGNGTETANGGWAYVILEEDETEFLHNSGGSISTTNNRMELTAMIKALEATATYCSDLAEFEIYTDSAYIYNCYVQKWYKNWQRNGWVNSAKKPVKNRDLWERIIPYFNDERYDFIKVKGHSNDTYNNLVDRMAVRAAREILEDYKE